MSEEISKILLNAKILEDSIDNIEEHENEYSEIISAYKGPAKGNITALEIMRKYFKYFPSLSEKVIDCLIELCEDDDVSIRTQHIKEMPGFFYEVKHLGDRITSTLAKLLKSEDFFEMQCIETSVTLMIKSEPKVCLKGLVNQILLGEKFIREKCIYILATNVKKLKYVTDEVEDYIVSEIKKILEDVTHTEFLTLMEVLETTKLGKTSSGRQELVDLVSKQVKLNLPFSCKTDVAAELSNLNECLRHALPYFSSEVNSSKFVVYICEQIFPELGEIFRSKYPSSIELEVLRIYAELCTYCGALDEPEKILEETYKKLILYSPLPPDDANESVKEPRLAFSYVECMLYAFHKLLKFCPVFLSDIERRKDFEIRLQYILKQVDNLRKELREAGKTEDISEKEVALKRTSNIDILIKDLIRIPPSFNDLITLSWEAEVGNIKGVFHPMKRSLDSTFKGVESLSMGEPSSKRQKFEFGKEVAVVSSTPSSPKIKLKETPILERFLDHVKLWGPSLEFYYDTDIVITPTSLTMNENPLECEKMIKEVVVRNILRQKKMLSPATVEAMRNLLEIEADSIQKIIYLEVLINLSKMSVEKYKGRLPYEEVESKTLDEIYDDFLKNYFTGALAPYDKVEAIEHDVKLETTIKTNLSKPIFISAFLLTLNKVFGTTYRIDENFIKNKIETLKVYSARKFAPFELRGSCLLDGIIVFKDAIANKDGKQEIFDADLFTLAGHEVCHYIARSLENNFNFSSPFNKNGKLIRVDEKNPDSFLESGRLFEIHLFGEQVNWWKCTEEVAVKFLNLIESSSKLPVFNGTENGLVFRKLPSVFFGVDLIDEDEINWIYW